MFFSGLVDKPGQKINELLDILSQRGQEIDTTERIEFKICRED